MAFEFDSISTSCSTRIFTTVFFAVFAKFSTSKIPKSTFRTAPFSWPKWTGCPQRMVAPWRASWVPSRALGDQLQIYILRPLIFSLNCLNGLRFDGRLYIRLRFDTVMRPLIFGLLIFGLSILMPLFFGSLIFGSLIFGPLIFGPLLFGHLIFGQLIFFFIMSMVLLV